MSSEYPSVGLRFDFNEIVRAQAILKGMKAEMLDLGKVAQQTGATITAAYGQRAQAAASSSAAVKQAAVAGSDAEAQAYAKSIADGSRSLQFKVRMWKQAAAEAERSAREQTSADAVAEQEKQRTAKQTFDFRTRIIRQREAEERRVAQAAAQADRQAQDEIRRQAQQTLEFQMRMNRQRAASYAQTQSEFNARNSAYGSLSRPELAGYAAGAMSGAGAAESGAIRTSLVDTLGLRTAFDMAGAAGQKFGAAMTGLRDVMSSLRYALFNVYTLVAVFLTGMAVAPIVHFADAMTALEARTRLYAKRATDVPYTFEAIYRTAQDARVPLEGIATLYTRLAPLADRLGRSQLDMLRTTKTVAESFTIGGATPEEARSSTQQLAQALGSNRLGGDELRSLSENAPVLLYKISQALNMNVGEFIKWAHAGNANAKVVIEAIDKASADIDAMFKTMPMTIGQSVSIVSNSFEHFIGEVNAATGAAQGIAGTIGKLASFFDQKSTIDGTVAAINGLGVALGFLGHNIAMMVAYGPTLAALFGSMAAAKILPPIFAALSRQMLIFEAAAAIAGRGTTMWNIAVTSATAAARGLTTSVAGLVSALGGTLGIVLISGVAAFNQLHNAQQTLASGGDMVRDSHERLAGAVTNAAATAANYGMKIGAVDDAVHRLTGAQNDATKATTDAEAAQKRAIELATMRAQAELLAAAGIADRAAAEDKADAKKLQHSEGVLSTALSFGIHDYRADPKAKAQVDTQHAQNLKNIQQLNDDAKQLETIAAAFRDQAKNPKITIPDLGGSPDADKNTADKKTQQRIDQLTREIKESMAVVEQLKKESATREHYAQAMSRFYAAGGADVKTYIGLMRQRADADLKAKQAEEEERIGAQYANEIRDDKTGKIVKLVGALKLQKDAELAAADAEKRAAQNSDAILAYQANISAIDAKTAALNKGTKALIDNDIAQRAIALAHDRGPNADPAQAALDAAEESRKQGLQDLAQMNRDRQIETRLAGMSSDEAEREQKALALSEVYMRAFPGLSQQFAENWARATVSAQQLQDTAENLKRTLKDSIRNAFIEGKGLDFKNIREAFTRTLRAAIYDAMLAKPIDIVVNAVVNVITKGIEELIKQLKDAASSKGGQDNPLSAFGDSFKQGMGKLGTQIGDMVKKLPPAVTNALKSASQFAGSAFAGYEAGTTLAEMVGLHGSKKDPKGQVVLDVAAAAIGELVGGPIGAAIATFISHAIGPALFGKESNHAAGGNFDANGRFTYAPTNKTNAETGKAAQDIGTALSGIQGELQKLGIDANGVITHFEIGQRDQSYINVRGEASPRRTAVGDPAALIEEASKAMLQKATFSDPAMKAFADQLLAAGKSFQDAVNELEKWQEAQKIPNALKTELLKYTDPKAYALKTLQDQQLQRRKDIKAAAAEGLLTQSQMQDINTTLTALEGHEIADALNSLGAAAGGAAASLQDLKDEQKKIADFAKGLLSSSFSPLSPEAQLAHDQGAYRSTLAQARAGDYGSLQSITDYAQNYLSDAQKFYGASAPYSQIFQEVQDSLDALSQQTFQDPMAAAIQQASTDLQQAIHDSGAEIVAAIESGTDATNDQISQQTEAWLQSHGLDPALLQHLQTGQLLDNGLLGGVVGKVVQHLQ